MRRLVAGRRHKRGALLCLVLVLALQGLSLAAAHDHVTGADFPQTCALCAVAHSPVQLSEPAELPEATRPILIASQVFTLSAPPARAPFDAHRSRAPPA